MKTLLLAAAALIATPLAAQTTQTSQPTPDGVMSPSTPGSTQQVQGPTPMPAPKPMPMAAPADPTMAPAAPMSSPAPSDASAMPMASTGKLPWCRAGQFTGCRERSNAKGEGLHKN